MKSPAFSFYVRDWLCSKTVSKLHSKNISKGVSAYLYLLCNSWLEEPQATLPKDLDELAGMARVSREEFDVIWPYIKDQFPVFSEERLNNERLMAESNKQVQRRFAGSKGGSKTVANRAAAHEDEDEDEKESVSTKMRANEVYDAYPRKVGKPAALRSILKAFQKIKPDELLEKTKSYANARNGEDHNFTPHPATWFNQERYNDDPKTWCKNRNEQDESSMLGHRNL